MRNASRALEIAAPLALVAFAAWVYWPLLAGDPPTTRDHGFVLYKIVALRDFLARGELYAWTDLEYAGFPPTLNYPVVGSLLVLALDALPGVSLEAAYARGVFFAPLLMALGVYVAGRIHFSRAVGWIAGALAAIDPGHWWMGGHEMVLETGMWIQTCSTGLLLAGMAVWARAMETRRTAHAVWAGGLLGWAVLFHPQAAVFGLPAGVLMVIAVVWVQRRRALGAVRITAIAVGVALVVSAFWLVPYLLNLHASEEPTYVPHTLAEFWADVENGRLLRLPALWVAAGGVGIVVLARRREIFPLFLALLVPTFAFAFTAEVLAFAGVRDPAAPGRIDTLQLKRSFYLARPALFLAGGATLALLTRRIAGMRGWWGVVAATAAAASIGLLLPSTRLWLPQRPTVVAMKGMSAEDAAHYSDALDAAAALTGPGERIVLFHPLSHDHSMVFEAAARRLPVLKIGMDAAALFQNRVKTDNPALLTRIGATAVVSRGQPPEALRSAPVVGTFGPFEVRQLPARPRAFMYGRGSVEVLAWSEEEIRLRVAGVSPGSRVRLGIGHWEGWRLADGSGLQRLPFHGQPLAAFDAVDGEHVIRYHPPRGAYAGPLITLLGIGGMLAFAARSFVRRGARGPQLLPVS